MDAATAEHVTETLKNAVISCKTNVEYMKKN